MLVDILFLERPTCAVPHRAWQISWKSVLIVISPFSMLLIYVAPPNIVYSSVSIVNVKIASRRSVIKM